MKIPISSAIAVALSASLLACSGDGDGGGSCTAAPIAIAQGTWCVTITGSTNNCAGYVIPPPYHATFTQSGSQLTATAGGVTYSGSLCGSSGTMAASSGGASVLVSLQFSDPSHATGTSDWSNPSCSGTDTFTAHLGTCL